MTGAEKIKPKKWPEAKRRAYIETLRGTLARAQQAGDWKTARGVMRDLARLGWPKQPI